MDKKKIISFAKKFSLSFLILFAAIFIPYHLAFAKKIIPGVWVGNLYLGGKDLELAYSQLDAYFSSLSKKEVTLVEPNSGRETKASVEDLGIYLNTKETLKNAYKIGRRGDFMQDSEDKIIAYRKRIKVAPVSETDNNLFSQKVRPQFSDLEVSFKESTLSIDSKGTVLFKEGAEGKYLNLDPSIDCLRKAVDAVALENAYCSVFLEDMTPKFTEEDFNAIRIQVEELLDLQIKLVWPGGLDVFSKSSLLDFYEVEPGGIFPSLEKATIYVQSLAKRVDKDPVNASFEVKGDGNLGIFTKASAGVQINQDKLIEDLVELLQKLVKRGDDSVVFELEVETRIIDPEITSVSNNYGIKELLGKGESNYRGSIANRIYNLKLASERLNGKLIPPGETVSFNALLGDVSTESGYKSAYVIIGNQTVLGAGGGVCQTSTTLFRSVLNAGLPILERTAHLYRVHYYEPPLGMDATVMAPYTDFIFKNDTPAHILIQTYVNEQTQNLVYEIFGTNDGREVYVSEPVIKNEIAPPEPRYQEDATLEKGKIVQVEWSSWGASVSFTRKVTNNSEIIQNDIFSSNYVAWPAVYMVGTKE